MTKSIKKFNYTSSSSNNYSSSYNSNNASIESLDVDEALVGSSKKYKTFNLSDEDLRRIASVCIDEQGTNINAIKYEASLMGNLTDKYGNGSVTDYVKSSGWFQNGNHYMSNTYNTVNGSKVTNEIINAVRDVLVNGNRTTEANEHDSFGDIAKIVDKDTGKVYTDQKDIRNRSNYKKGKTVIYNTMGSIYVFDSFPSSTSDPFGKKTGEWEGVKKNKSSKTTSSTSIKSASSKFPSSTSDAVRMFQNNSSVKSIKNRFGSRLSILKGTYKDSDGTYVVRYKVDSTSSDPNVRYYTFKIFKDGSIKYASQIQNIYTKNGQHMDFDGNVTGLGTSKGTSIKSATANTGDASLVGVSSYPNNNADASSIIANDATLKARMNQYKGNWTHDGVKKDGGGHYYDVYHCTDVNGNKHDYNIRINKNKDGSASTEVVVAITNNKDGTYTHINRDAKIYTVKNKDGTTTWEFINNKRTRVLSSTVKNSIKSTSNSSSSLVKNFDYPTDPTVAARIISSNTVLNDRMGQYKGKWTNDGVKKDKGGNYYNVYHCTDVNGNSHDYNIRLNKDGSTDVVVALTNNKDGTFTHIYKDNKRYISKNKSGVTTTWEYKNNKKTKVLATVGSIKSAASNYPDSVSDAVNMFQNYNRIKSIKSQYGDRVVINSGTKKNADGTYTVGYKVNPGNGDTSTRYYTFTITSAGKITEASQITLADGSWIHKDANGNKTSGTGKKKATISSVTNTSGASSKGVAALNAVKKYAGHTAYQWGGSNINGTVPSKDGKGGDGIDCSHFVQKAFNMIGINVPYAVANDVPTTYASYGFKDIGTDLSKAKPGDIVCKSGHVGIVGDNGYLIEALGEKWGVVDNITSLSSAKLQKKVTHILRYVGK